MSVNVFANLRCWKSLKSSISSEIIPQRSETSLILAVTASLYSTQQPSFKNRRASRQVPEWFNSRALRCFLQVSDTGGKSIDSYRIDQVIEAGVCRRLVELLPHESAEIQVLALRIVGRIISSGNDKHQKQVRGACNAGSIPLVPWMCTLPAYFYACPQK